MNLDEIPHKTLEELAKRGGRVGREAKAKLKSLPKPKAKGKK